MDYKRRAANLAALFSLGEEDDKVRNRSERIHIRLEPELKSLLLKRSCQLGKTVSDIFRESLLSKDFVVVESNPAIGEFKSELSAIGRNLNQMVRAMNRLNVEARNTFDINLYTQNPEFREIAEKLDALINSFQQFNIRFSASEKELCQVYTRRVLFDDIEEILADDPDLLREFRER